MAEFNPVLVKELRSRMRGARAFVLLSIYLLILSGVALLFYTAIADISSSDLNSGRTIGKTLFLLIGTVALIEVCIITPTLTSGSIAGEKVLLVKPQTFMNLSGQSVAAALNFYKLPPSALTVVHEA